MTDEAASAALDWIDGLVFDEHGLIPAVVVSSVDGGVRMLGYMNRAAIGETLARGRVTFWSRSRAELWVKGETSGHTLALEELHVDCDRDALLVVARPVGPTCHTGAVSCFFRPVFAPKTGDEHEAPQTPGVHGELQRLQRTIEARKRGLGTTQAEGKSYVRSLLDAGAPKLAAKLVEEATELGVALASETDARVVSEAADLLFHLLVSLASRDLSLAQVEAELARRSGTSGLDEKAARRESTAPTPAPETTHERPAGSRPAR